MSDHKRILFLDVDGVLNSTNSMVATGERYVEQMSPLSVMLLLRIMILTDAEVVMSSTWRYSKQYPHDFLARLSDAGWPKARPFPLIGATPETQLEKGIRGDEVQEWIGINRPDFKPWTDYICIDDNSDFHPWQPLVLTDPVHGLSFSEYQKILTKWNVDDKTEAKLVLTSKTEVHQINLPDKFQTGGYLW